MFRELFMVAIPFRDRKASRAYYVQMTYSHHQSIRAPHDRVCTVHKGIVLRIESSKRFRRHTL